MPVLPRWIGRRKRRDILSVSGKNKEDRPLKKRVSLGMLLALLLAAAMISTGFAADRPWTVLDYMLCMNLEGAYITTPVGQESETETAMLRVDSAIYDGRTLAFDWALTNKDIMIPMWASVDELTVNGQDTYWIKDSEYEPVCDFEERWIPDYIPEPEDKRTTTTLWGGELFRLPDNLAGQETLHVHLKTSIYRPVRPVAFLVTGDNFREPLEQKIAEGYYVIPGDLDGFFVPEEDLNVCPNGWAITVGGSPEPGIMGDLSIETLEISFDVPKTELTEGIRQLEHSEKTADEEWTAMLEEADISSLGLRLTLKITPNGNQEIPEPRGLLLTDAAGNRLEGEPNITCAKEDRIYSTGDRIIQLRWPKVREEDLPDEIRLEYKLKNDESRYFSVKIR